MREPVVAAVVHVVASPQTMSGNHYGFMTVALNAHDFQGRETGQEAKDNRQTVLRPGGVVFLLHPCRLQADQPVRRGELMIFLNSASIASLMPSVGLTSKKKPGEAHSFIFSEILLWNGRIQFLYQSFSGSGR